MDSRTPVARRTFLAAAGGVGGVAGVGTVDARRSGSESLDEASGTTDVVLRFDPVDAESLATGADPRESLRQHAGETRAGFHRAVAESGVIDVQREFWLANAVLATVDFDAVSVAELTAIDGVRQVHPNEAAPAADVLGPNSTDSVDPAGLSGPDPANHDDGAAVSYGVEMLDAPDVWDRYGTRGEGVSVAVIDSGVDPAGHDGIETSLGRGGWAEFDRTGAAVDSDPNDPLGHGTGVSSLVVGDRTPDGRHYGIAPEAALYAAKVHDEQLSFSAILAGMEWALENDVDVMSLSIGPLRYDRAYIEPVTNALRSDVVVASSIGNVGPGTSVSPAAIPGVLSVGFVHEDGTVHDDSGGELVRTERYWAEAARDDWPAEYVTPSVVGPGVDVPLARPGGEFATGGGASYSTPYLAGVAALVRSATGADGPSVRDAIVDTAVHPAASDPFDVDPGRDDRYGSGIPSAAATAASLDPGGTLTGRVTTQDGTPVGGTTVESAAGPVTTTDGDGNYALDLPPGEQTVRVTKPGFESQTRRIDPVHDSRADVTLAPSDTLAVELKRDLPERIDPGSEATAAVTVANAAEVRVVASMSGLAQESNLDLMVNGTSAEFGESVALGIGAGLETVPVTVAVDDGVPLARFALEYEFVGPDGRTVTGSGNSVHVHPRPVSITADTPGSLQELVDLVAPHTTIELTGGVATETVEEGDPGALVIDKPLTILEADDGTPTIQAEGGGSDDAAAVYIGANDVTVDGLTIEANGTASGIRVGTEFQNRDTEAPSGVRVSWTTITGATTGIDARTAPALVLEGNDVRGGEVGIAVGGATGTTLRQNRVSGAETGLAIEGLVLDVAENELADISGTAIQVSLPAYLVEAQHVQFGPIRGNVISAVGDGIVVSGSTNGAIENNRLTDVGGTAIRVDGAVLAPIRSNAVTRADRGIVVGDGASVDELADNTFEDVRQEIVRGASTPAGGTTPTPFDGSGGGGGSRLLLYGSTTVSLALLVVPYAIRRFKRD